MYNLVTFPIWKWYFYSATFTAVYRSSRSLSSRNLSWNFDMHGSVELLNLICKTTGKPDFPWYGDNFHFIHTKMVIPQFKTWPWNSKKFHSYWAQKLHFLAQNSGQFCRVPLQILSVKFALSECRMYFVSAEFPLSGCGFLEGSDYIIDLALVWVSGHGTVSVEYSPALLKHTSLLCRITIWCCYTLDP